MNKNFYLFSVPVLLFLFFCFPQKAFPAKSYSETNLFELSLDEILSLKVSLPSKRQEPIFDAPLSASVITRDEIRSSGATSIPEALRLVPGVIVREQSPGNFDVHLRGFDFMPPSSSFAYSVNTSTLVMIDGRVVYNYFQGGTFWETLPVSVHDIEQIEVVRGPAAALYGPNAATGVINIITRGLQKEGWSVSANFQAGSYRSKLGHALIGYQKGSMFSFGVNTNFTERNRHQSAYYDFYQNRYVRRPSDIIRYSTGDRFPNPQRRYPRVHNASDNFGINAFLTIAPDDTCRFDLRGGYQNAEVQKINVDVGATPFTTNQSHSYYLHLTGQVHDFAFKYAFNKGDHDVLGVRSLSYDFEDHDFTADYTFEIGRFLFQPGVNFRKAFYDGMFIGGRKHFTTLAFSMRSEYRITEKLKLIAATRSDNYNHPSQTYFSWQFALSYMLRDDILLRASYSRAYRAPFFIDIYTDLDLTRNALRGNRRLNMAFVDSYEVGIRTHITDITSFDVELFYARTKDYAFMLPDKKIDNIMYFRYNNLPLSAWQVGMTASFNYKPRHNLFLKLFATWQRTELDDYTPDYSNLADRKSGRHRATPSLYGGITLNWVPVERLNINTSLYYYTRQRFEYIYTTTHNGSKCIVNAKADYRLTHYLSLFVNARNLLNTDTREFAFADRIKATYLLGMEISY